VQNRTNKMDNILNIIYNTHKPQCSKAAQLPMHCVSPPPVSSANSSPAAGVFECNAIGLKHLESPPPSDVGLESESPRGMQLPATACQMKVWYGNVRLDQPRTLCTTTRAPHPCFPHAHIIASTSPQFCAGLRTCGGFGECC
jgi:hypothetical protein